MHQNHLIPTQSQPRLLLGRPTQHTRRELCYSCWVPTPSVPSCPEPPCRGMQKALHALWGGSASSQGSGQSQRTQLSRGPASFHRLRGWVSPSRRDLHSQELMKQCLNMLPRLWDQLENIYPDLVFSFLFKSHFPLRAAIKTSGPLLGVKHFLKKGTILPFWHRDEAKHKRPGKH